MIAAIVTIVVVALAVGGYLGVGYLTRPALTFHGRPIADAGAPLRQAERSVAELVGRRHGAENGDTRCYYARPAGRPDAGDVGETIYCGPVLFIDGDRSRPYLSFTLAGAPTAGEAIALSASSEPVQPNPAAVPAGVHLVRPDGQQPPTGPGTLAVPQPPQAQPNVITVVSGLADTLPTSPPSAMMASQEVGIWLTRAGTLTRFGVGDDARTPPAGQHFVAFTTQPAPGQYGSADPSSQVAVSVPGAPLRALPATKAGQAVVIGVPDSGPAPTLVLDADGVTQTLTLPAGKPGAGNLTVLTRSHRQVPLPVQAPITLTLGSSPPIAGTVTASQAVLGYWARSGQNHASAPSKALLALDLALTTTGQPEPLGFDPALLTLTPVGGAPIKAADLDPGPNVYVAFEVPADFTAGNVVIAGSENTPAGTPLTVAQPVTIPVAIPGG